MVGIDIIKNNESQFKEIEIDCVHQGISLEKFRTIQENFTNKDLSGNMDG